MSSPEPEADLTRRFNGLDRLFGPRPAQAIRQSHVAVVGMGGVGSWAAEALARSGVGTLTLIDMDHVAESNVNRQIHALSTTLGMAKVDAMRERIAQINPACRVQGIDDFVTAENWPAILPGGVQGVVDACDQVRAKTAMAAWARSTGLPFITVGAAGGKQMAHAVDIADLADVTHDPLLAQVRQRLRKAHGAPKQGKPLRVACVYSKEAVRPADAACDLQSDGSLSCHGYGSLVTVTATFGMSAAGWLMQKISHISEAKAQALRL